MDANVLNEPEIETNTSFNHPVKQSLVMFHEECERSLETIGPHKVLKLALDPTFQINHEQLLVQRLIRKIQTN